MLDERELKQYDRWNVPRPSHTPHGTEQDIQANLSSVKPRNWRQEGNRLIADTDWGELVQLIPVDYLLDGIDERGLPKFKRIEYS